VIEKNVGINAIDYSVADICFSPSGKNALYCSNAMGGSGKSDIYIAEVIIDSISGRVLLQNPVNLGAKVNTLMTECSPTYISDNIIAFSSNGHIGLGGKDIYFYNLISTELRNAGSAINSPFDEYFPTCNGNRFYFSSNRLGEFKNRIFGCELPAEKLELILTPPTPIVIDQVSQIDTNEISDKTQLNNIHEDSLYAAISNQQIHFVWYHPQNDLKIDAKHYSEIDSMLRLLRKYTNWSVEIRSYTDSRGSVEQNILLSQKRAGFIADLMITMGISQDRISVFGLGEASPVNHCVDGVDCFEEEYSINRRTEITLNPKPKEIK
jgi:outer membrane protein OmpA-like peptidoglycan-associated protein